MTTARRSIRSCPYRDADSTWTLIVDLLTQGAHVAARAELMAVAGVVSSIIADRFPVESPIIVTCNGPRTRIYCQYDDDALDGDNSSEEWLGFDPLKGDWSVSLPCAPADLAWVQRALKATSSRITARDLSTGFALDQAPSASEALTLNVDGFLQP